MPTYIAQAEKQTAPGDAEQGAERATAEDASRPDLSRQPDPDHQAKSKSQSESTLQPRSRSQRLVVRCGIGESTLKRGLAILEKRGLVEALEDRFGGKDRRTAYYLPILPDTPRCAITQGRQVDAEAIEEALRGMAS